MNGRLKKLLKYLVAAVILFLFASGICVNLTSRKLLPVFGLGNTPENINKLNLLDSDSYKFMVISDTQYGVATASNLFRLSKSEPIDFGIYAGDLVAKPLQGYYRFFLDQYSGWDVKFPVFVLPGNHDIAGDPIGEKIFQEMFGTLQTYFIFGNDLFVLLNNGKDKDDLTGKNYAWLENVLRENYEGKRYIFLFMHKPSAWNYGPGERRDDNDPSFKTLHDLVKKYNVNYVFSGHIHGFKIENRDGHVYMISGGGGGGLRFADGFHHFVEMNVSPDGINYKLVKSDRKFNLYTEFKRIIISQLASY